MQTVSKGISTYGGHSCCSQISGNPLLNMNQIPEGKTEKQNKLLWFIWRTALGTQISLIPSPWMRCSWERSVFVCWVRCVHVAHQSTHSFALPQLSWKILVKTVHVLSLRTMLVTKNGCQLRMENWFSPPPKSNHAHSHPDPSSPFFWSKTSGKKLGSSPPEERSLLWERWADWNTHWWCPKTRNPAVGTSFLEDTLFAMQSNAKIDQCVETTLRWNWPKQVCAKSDYYWQKTLCCSFPTPPWCDSFSILCQIFWVDSFKHDPSEQSLFWHAFFP